MEAREKLAPDRIKFIRESISDADGDNGFYEGLNIRPGELPINYLKVAFYEKYL